MPYVDMYVVVKLFGECLYVYGPYISSDSAYKDAVLYSGTVVPLRETDEEFNNVHR